MKESEIIIEERPKLKNAIALVGLPGIGHIGRIAVDYLVHQLKAKKFAELYSPYFFPFVIVHDDKIHQLRNEFFYWKNPKGNDLILVIGDSQTYDPKGHYEIAGKIVDFVRSLGAREIITIGGFSTGRVADKPRVFGVVTTDDQAKELAKHGVELKVSGQIGTIVGAAGLLVGIGHIRGLKSYTILGETSGFPIVTDPTSAEAVLEVMQKILGIKVDLSKLKQKVDEMHEFIKKINDIQQQAMEQMQKPKKADDLKYIG